MGKIFVTWISILFAIILIGFLLVWPLVWMWNYVMPQIFGLPEITYWQMYWLYMLIQILFKTNVTVNNK